MDASLDCDALYEAFADATRSDDAELVAAIDAPTLGTPVCVYIIEVRVFYKVFANGTYLEGLSLSLSLSCFPESLR